MPGASLVKWRVYSVLFNAAAAIAAGQLGLLLGLSERAARLTTRLSAFGVGTLWTISNPYTADPVIFLLTPTLTALLLRERVARAGLIAGFGVFVKEFAAAPLWIVAIYASLVGRRELLVRVLIAAAAVTLMWLAFHVVLVSTGHARYGDANPDNPATSLFAGGYVRFWLRTLGWRGAVAAVCSTYTTLYVLMPAGLRVCGRQLRQLTLAALPAAAALVYVETPERALWNFFFLAIPLAAIALARLPDLAVSAFVAMYGLANLRIGAQIMLVPPSRYALVASSVLALAALAIPSRPSLPDVARWS